MDEPKNTSYLESEESDSNFSTDSLEEITSNKTCTNNLNSKIFIKKFLTEKNDIYYEKDKNKIKFENTYDKLKENNVIIPFYSQELTLAELKKLQKSARKKIKLPRKKDTIPPTPNYANNSQSNDKNEFYLPLDNISTYSESISTRSDHSKVYCTFENSRITRSTARTSRSPASRNKSAVEKTRGRSVSYLEQYRKKIELKNNKQIKNESVCSTIGSSNLSCNTPLSLSEIPDTYSKSNANFFSESEEMFYQEIMNNKIFVHSSPRSSCNSIKEHVKNDSGNDSLRNKENRLQRKITEENEKITQLLNKKEKGKTNQRKHKNRPQNDFVVLGTLGPDLEETKQKMGTFLKRKEYGNKVSCKNRLEILQKRECYSLKPVEDTKSLIPIPVTTYSIIPIGDGNALTLRISSKKQHTKVKENGEITNKSNNKKKKTKETAENKEKRLNLNKNDTNNNYMINEDTTEMMLRRHELEKKLAEKIRNQLANK